MSAVIITITHTIWDWLPQLTIGLRFATALISFGVAVTAAFARIRRWIRR